jgi:hypothetical protein
MCAEMPRSRLELLANLAQTTPGIDVLMLFGSRGRGDAHATGLPSTTVRDGQMLVETKPRLAEQFRLDAAQFWYDAAPVDNPGRSTSSRRAQCG